MIQDTTNPFHDLQITQDELGVARVQDIVLAEKLGYERPRDIRQLINRHNESLTELGILICGTVQQIGAGRPGKEYHLSQEQAVFITMKAETAAAISHSIFIAQVFTAYKEGKLIPRTYADALDLASQQARLIEDLKPKAVTYDKFHDSNNLHRSTDVAQTLGISAIRLNKKLALEGVWRKGDKKRVPKQEYIDAGYFETLNFVDKDTGWSGQQSMFTPKGAHWVQEMFREI